MIIHDHISNILLCAMASAASYGANPALQGFETVTLQRLGLDSKYLGNKEGTVFFNPEYDGSAASVFSGQGKILIAFRGTEPTPFWPFAHDIKQWFASRYDRAFVPLELAVKEKFIDTQAVTSDKVYFCGHSLGGEAVNLASVRNRIGPFSLSQYYAISSPHLRARTVNFGYQNDIVYNIWNIDVDHVTYFRGFSTAGTGGTLESHYIYPLVSDLKMLKTTSVVGQASGSLSEFSPPAITEESKVYISRTPHLLSPSHRFGVDHIFALSARGASAKGSIGSDVLYSTGPSATLTGGGGADKYILSSASDRVVENPAKEPGEDWVYYDEDIPPLSRKRFAGIEKYGIVSSRRKYISKFVKQNGLCTLLLRAHTEEIFVEMNDIYCGSVDIVLNKNPNKVKINMVGRNEMTPINFINFKSGTDKIDISDVVSHATTKLRSCRGTLTKRLSFYNGGAEIEFRKMTDDNAVSCSYWIAFSNNGIMRSSDFLGLQ